MEDTNQAFAVRITGLPASGKSTVAAVLARSLRELRNHVPGLQTVYKPPEKPEIVIRGDQDDPEQAVRRIFDVLTSKHFVPCVFVSLCF